VKEEKWNKNLFEMVIAGNEGYINTFIDLKKGRRERARERAVLLLY
jgi:hypothetical protein